MSLILRQIARYFAHKAVSKPEAREQVVNVARDVVQEAKKIATEENRAYAAGRAFRRAFDKLQSY